ncbi:MAG TPA: hypothetical protein VJA22_00095, partial [Patescibacteria group bacterium]|nr:hypothetical protein [Patescibacteria group bacterium]
FVLRVIILGIRSMLLALIRGGCVFAGRCTLVGRVFLLMKVLILLGFFWFINAKHKIYLFFN